MIWGIKDNKKVNATPKGTAICPICKSELIAKCGIVKKWHWSHKSLEDCDSWSEPESEWHLNWKNYFKKEEQEIVIENHRADIKTERGLIIEIQNSSICPDDICDREKFYDNMIWLLNGDTFGKGLGIRDKGNYFTFVWKNPPKSWFYSEKDIYIDIEKKVKGIEEMYDDCNERLNIVFYKLKELFNKNPREVDFNSYGMYDSDKVKKFLRENELDLTELEILDKEEVIKRSSDLWSDLSEELRNLKRERKIYDNKTILIIKKLYKKIPCAGWGYLISKGDFLKKFGGKYEEEI